MNVKLSADHKKEPIRGAESVYRILQAILLRENAMRRAQEHFWVLGFNNLQKLLFMELVTLGTNNRVFAKAPEVFRMAIYKTATRVILAHNHPSGNLKPSKADMEFTDRILKAGKLIEIDVVDHLIVTETGYFSFEEHGYIHDLKNNGNYELVSRQERDMLALRAEMDKEKAEREKAKSIAAKMKAKGMDEKIIKELTGLKLFQIRKL